MPNELAVQAITALRTASDSSSDTKVTTFEPASQPEHEAASPIPNPSLQLEPALGLVVIEFRNDSGAVTTSIPSERQIAAYQRWQQTKFGPAPDGMHTPAPKAAPQPTPHEPTIAPQPAAHEPAMKAAPQPAPPVAAVQHAPEPRVVAVK